MKYALWILFLVFGHSAVAQKAKPSPALDNQLKTVLTGFRGNVGLYVRHLGTGQTVAINADSLFPTASTVKIPIQCGLFDQIQQGKLTYRQELVYRDSIKYDNGVIGSLKDSTVISLPEVIALMETLSDNTGSLWCQALAGGGVAINNWLEINGFHQTRVNSRTPGREAFRTRYGWGQTTPRELANLLTYIHDGRAVSADASDRMYRNLTRQYWDGDALSQLPAGISVATKNGAVNKSRSEVVLVHAPHGDYVFCIMTSNQADERWTRDNEGSALVRAVSALLWRTFEPTSSWKPVPGYEKWY